MKKRGRPKGITTNCNRITQKVGTKCITFDQKASKETDVIILEWFVGKEIAKSAVDDGLVIKEEQVETCPEMVSTSCVDKLVNIRLIKKYCTEDAWKSINSIYCVKVELNLYICNFCKSNADAKETSVMCSLCLQWQHLSCARLKYAPKARHWFCYTC
ncbi:unnamed protein product [Mytilus edulis]|uniref:PHD-type domain-containing protein n=1 Tax=Mytilus edulis TaxID=6550 RepID=A0A8S3V7R1_MYTED|nr:unnamed protein product [Mytilus edulis]